MRTLRRTFLLWLLLAAVHVSYADPATEAALPDFAKVTHTKFRVRMILSKHVFDTKGVSSSPEFFSYIASMLRKHPLRPISVPRYETAAAAVFAYFDTKDLNNKECEIVVYGGDTFRIDGYFFEVTAPGEHFHFVSDFHDWLIKNPSLWQKSADK